MRSTIKVLIVDDSALIRQMLARALGMDPRIEIVGVAKTGVEAIEKATELSPDVITLDVQMPELSGIEALPYLMRSTPARVVMLSGVDDPDTTYQALSLGAVDFIAKPKDGFATSLTALSELLLKKIKTAYRISPDRRRAHAVNTAMHVDAESRPPAETTCSEDTKEASQVVAIASSTGGPPALETVFSGLTSSLPAAFLIVQHLPSGFTKSLARRLSKVTDISIEEGSEDSALHEGVAYIAPYGTHMLVGGGRHPRIRLMDGDPMHGVRPAADPLLSSVADVFGASSTGVVLTGMGSDGALGLLKIRESGGTTIVQDEETSTVWGMPKAAVRMGAADRPVALQHVAVEIRRSLREGRQS